MTYDRDYDLRYELPEFDTFAHMTADGMVRGLCLQLEDGRYVIATDLGGMDMPLADDFEVSVYPSEDAFYEDPHGSRIASATSENFADIDLALYAVEFAK